MTGGFAAHIAVRMRAVLYLAAIVTALRAGVALSAADAAFTPEDHYRIKTAGDVQLSPDGSRLAFVESSIDRQANRNVTRVWLMTIATATLTPLTPEGASDTSPRWSPDGSSIAVLSSVDGQPAVVIANARDGSRRTLVHFQSTTEPLAYQGVGEQIAWSPDGKRLAYLSADPGPEPAGADPYVITRLAYKSWTGINDNRRWHINVIGVADQRKTPLTTGDRQEHSIAWSANDEIVFVSNRETDPDRVHNYDVFAVKVADRSIRQITRTAGTEYMPSWSSDGKAVTYIGGTRALTTRESNAEDTHVWTAPASGGAGRELAPALDRRVAISRFGPDGRSVYFIVEDHGNRVLYRVGSDGTNPEPLVGAPGNVGAFSVGRDGLIAYTYASPQAPAEVFIKSGNQAPRQLTHLNPWMNGYRASAPEAFEFASFDGTRVQGFATPPAGQQPGRKYPVVLMIHGGPHGQQGPAFNLKSQVYASSGYATVMVNYRGSTGYGQKHSDGTVNDQNGGEAKDVLAGLDHALKTYSYMDADRVVVEGGSYGGQLTNWLITQTPRFKAAIPSASISNLVSLAYTIWAADYMQVEYQGYPWQRDIADKLWERSAIRYVANVKTPTMFIHGEMDEDVVIGEPEQMYNALKQLGVEAVFLRYPREGHGLREPAHVVDAMKRSLDWYARWLRRTDSDRLH
jgi:dipeptidyl aminopeptidase/acylaminoacyl peptidase